jgi:hypothetical protein
MLTLPILKVASKKKCPNDGYEYNIGWIFIFLDPEGHFPHLKNMSGPSINRMEKRTADIGP